MGTRVPASAASHRLGQAQRAARELEAARETLHGARTLFDPTESLAAALRFLDERLGRTPSAFDRIYGAAPERTGGQPRGGGRHGYTPDHRRAARDKNRRARRARRAGR